MLKGTCKHKLLCFLGFHDWIYNSIDIDSIDINIGTERVCQQCDRKEVYTRNVVTGQYRWFRLR